MATPALVQTWGVSGGSTTFVTLTATAGSSTTAGNAIIVAVSMQKQEPDENLSCTDSQGNTYTALTQTAGTVGSSTTFIMRMFYALGIAGGSCVVTVNTNTGSDSFWRIHCHEVSGLSAFDASNQGTGASGALNSGSVTPSVANDFLLGYGLDNSGTVGTYGSGWSLALTEGAESTEYQVASTTASVAATYTGDGSGWICQVAAFKPTGGGGGVTPHNLPLLGCGS